MHVTHVHIYLRLEAFVRKSACYCAVVVGGSFQAKTGSVLGHRDAFDKLKHLSPAKHQIPLFMLNQGMKP